MLQVFYKGFVAAHQFGKARYVVRNGEGVVPGAAFVEAGGVGEIGPVLRVERRKEGAIQIDGPKALVLRIVVVLVAQGAVIVTQGFFLVPQGGGQAGQGIIGHIILQGMGNGVVAGEIAGKPAQGDVAALHIRIVVRTHAVLRARGISTLLEGIPGRGDVEGAQAAQPGIGNDADGGVPFHRPGFPAEEFPFGHPAPFLVHVNHGMDHIGLLLRPQKGHELVKVAVGVPK